MQLLKANLPQAIIYPPNKGRRKRTNLKLLQFIKQTIGCCSLSKKPQVAAACSLSKNTQVVAIYPKKKKKTLRLLHLMSGRDSSISKTMKYEPGRLNQIQKLSNNHVYYI